MNLDQRLKRHIGAISQAPAPLSTDIIPLIDLTLLDKQASPLQLSTLAQKAQQHEVAAICVLPEHLMHIPLTNPIKRATVINFPSGQISQDAVIKSIEDTVRHHTIHEIDYVFPYAAYLNNQQTEALHHYKAIYSLCKQHQLTIKVILETGALPSIDLIYQLSLEILNIGCDFLKTSTGKIPQGASIPAVFSMLSAIIDQQSSCGIKISGGIKTAEQAITYMTLSEQMMKHALDRNCFRIGASSLLDELI